MYILAPKMHILAPEMYIVAPEMDILAHEMDKSLPFERYSHSDSFCTWFDNTIGLIFFFFAFSIVFPLLFHPVVALDVNYYIQAEIGNRWDVMHTINEYLVSY